ncbi:uncharacterized protein LOC131620300 isoform X10 [Vicia villosa]|uniref:uncharacterized protein LOC131608910 isoform X4 n=1 Tax=Vicia villosa TaxID=3911 RepID=UPI00273C1DC6|nr:uncharacterized protein LOC131608910 isoform X4 [Vicia villosa]XP_058747315.1 uncharacterized protein LOC131620300 isoform X10 [Vicia villosa]
MFLDKSTSAISDTYKLNCFHTTTMSFVRLDTLSDQFITQSIMLIYLCVLAETKLGSVMINCLGHLQCLGHLHQSQQEKDYAKVALLLHKRDLLMTSWATTKSSLLNDSITRV